MTVLGLFFLSVQSVNDNAGAAIFCLVSSGQGVISRSWVREPSRAACKRRGSLISGDARVSREGILFEPVC